MICDCRFCTGDIPGEPDNCSNLGDSERERRINFIGETYLKNDEALKDGDPILAVVTREFWNRCVLREGADAPRTRPKMRQSFEVFSETEGAAPTVVSLFRFYAEVDRFMNFFRKGPQDNTIGKDEYLDDGSASWMDMEDHAGFRSPTGSDSDIGGLDAGPALYMFSNCRNPRLIH